MNSPLQNKNKIRVVSLRAAYSAIVLALGLICCSCSGTRETTASTPRSRTNSQVIKMQTAISTIKIGDLVELSVLGYPEFQTSSTVKESGALMVPLVGEINAAGLSKQQFIETLRKKLAEFIKGEPEITIGISSTTSQRISVLGAVTRQDNYSINGEISLVAALAAAGGITPESDLKHVRIIHNENADDFEEVDLASYIELGNLESVPKVQSGDLVYVPKRENVVRSFSDFLRDAVFLFGAFRLFY